MSTPAATVMVSVSVPAAPGGGLAGLQARAKAVSPKAKIIPPWAMPKPLSISCRSVMRMVACPSSSLRTSMPIHSEA